MSGREAELEYEQLLARHVSDPGVRAALARYAGLLERWAAVHNLVRFGSREELVERHLLDSLAGAGGLGARGRLLDVGSGAGLPGVPLLVACGGWSGVLLEPRQKRWAFLRTAVRELGLSAEVVAERYESLPDAFGRFDLVCARAVGGHLELVRWARDRLGPGGRVRLWTTEEDARALGGVAGWRVVLSPLPGLERGRLAELQPCFT